MIDNQSQFQEWQSRLAAIADSGAPIDASGVRMLHERSTSKALTEEWLAIFDELTSPEFIEAAESLPYLDGADEADNRVPGPGQPWEIEDKARKFLTDTVLFVPGTCRTGPHHRLARWIFRLRARASVVRNRKYRWASQRDSQEIPSARPMVLSASC